ncbi:MAG TPA: hypothetical protein DHU65_00340 [Clostridiales bacterium]|nr:hypothetical protein [Clostridiales bacterium]
MKAFIDIGSNSVRLMLYENGVTIDKFVKVTKLADGLFSSGTLNPEAIKRTAEAVDFYVKKAVSEGADKVYAFATAAVRQTKNGKEFCDVVLKDSGIKIDVVSGEAEAKLGLTGVLKGKDGGIIDIGGASSEIAVVKNGELVYSYSLPYGVVKIKDACGNNYFKTDDFTKEKIKEYGFIPKSKFYGIGGTATQIAAIALKLAVYDRNKVNGYVLTENIVKAVIDEVNGKTMEELKAVTGLDPARADVILGGAVMLKNIMERIGVSQITVSEDDNLEGYAIIKEEENE